MALPFPNSTSDYDPASRSAADKNLHWVGVAAAGTIVAGGLLLLAGKRRAGLLTAASGTALALLEQQDTLRSWWSVLPTYLAEVQQLLGKVQGTVDDLAAQRAKLHRVLDRKPSA
jgi:hypothetical protein